MYSTDEASARAVRYIEAVERRMRALNMLDSMTTRTDSGLQAISRSIIAGFPYGLSGCNSTMYTRAPWPNPGPRCLKADRVWCPPWSQGLDSPLNNLEVHVCREACSRCVAKAPLSICLLRTGGLQKGSLLLTLLRCFVSILGLMGITLSSD